MDALRSRAIGRHGVTALAAGVAIGALIEDLVSPTVRVGDQRYDRGSEAVIITVLCGVVALVALRQRLGVSAPLGAISLIGLASLGARSWVLDSSFMFLLAMLMCGLFGYLAVTRTQQAGVVVMLAAGGLAVWRHHTHTWAGSLAVPAFMLIAWVVGMLIRRPVRQARSAEARASQLEVEQEAAARSAVAEERQRIARELHDIIAHSVSVMTVQTGAVRRLLTPDQEREREALLSVERTGRDALAEMRRLVGLLREDGINPEYAPQPGMQSLEALLANVRAAGLSVDLDVAGTCRDLPPGKDLAAYRVVQEALTNALKHGRPGHAVVHVHWGDDELRIEVANDGADTGTGVPAANNGYGHAGMRERLGLYGGGLDSGPQPGGGYVVRARLPIEDER